MNIAKKVYEEGVLKLKENAPQIIVSLIVAALIWLFGVLVFIPLADMLGNPYVFGLTALKPIISAIIGIALIILFLRIAKDFGELMDGVADILVSIIAKDRITEEKLEKYRRGFRGLAYLIVVIIAYLFAIPILAGISPVIAGIVLILIVIWAVFVLLTLGNLFHKEIEEGVRLAIKKLEEKAKSEEEGNQ